MFQVDIGSSLLSELKLFTYLYQYSSNGYFHAQSFPQACQVEFPKDRSLVLFSFLFTSTPLMNSSHLMAFNAKCMSIASKFASPAKDLNSKLHAFIPNCLFKSPFISKKNLKPSVSKIELLFATQKTFSTRNFFISAGAKSFQLLTQQFWSYPWLLPLCHIPLWSHWKSYLFYT